MAADVFCAVAQPRLGPVPLPPPAPLPPRLGPLQQPLPPQVSSFLLILILTYMGFLYASHAVTAPLRPVARLA